MKKYKTNYSWKTSLPAYLENKMGKHIQEKLCLYVIKKLKGKKGSIKEVQDYLRTRYRINLPQSTISGRFGDLRDNKKIAFYGELTVYRGRLRKVFQVFNKRKKPVSLKKKNRKMLKKKKKTTVKKPGIIHMAISLTKRWRDLRRNKKAVRVIKKNQSSPKRKK